MDKKSSKKLKKRLLITFVIISAVLLLMYLLTVLIPYFYNIQKAKNTEEVIADYSFYTPNYEEDIFADKRYNELIENGILTYDNGVNSVTVVTPETAAHQGDDVKLLVDMVYSIINGDNDKYNSYFSDEYFKINAPKDEFTMQKIYNAVITAYAAENVSDKDGNYTKYTYKLIYNIYENNGTFRKDIGDAARVQYIEVTDRNGSYLIDSIYYEETRH